MRIPHQAQHVKGVGYLENNKAQPLRVALQQKWVHVLYAECPSMRGPCGKVCAIITASGKIQVPDLDLLAMEQSERVSRV